MKGLTNEQVNERIKNKQYNYDTTIKTKSIKQIYITNICTLFNFINIIFGILILMVGSYKNLLFLGTILCNIIIGISQEIKSKKIIDKLSLITEKKVTVIRNNQKQTINKEDIVIDDIVIYETGNQIPTDTIIIEGEVEVNESLLTGEINPIKKQIGDTLLSGSFIVSGKIVGQVIHVNIENYTYKITKEAKYIKTVNSEIMKFLKQIIKVISCIIIPLGIIFFIKQRIIVKSPLEQAIINTVAALISVIPDGLMLLTSTVMAMSVIKLSKYKVLVQDLYSIEKLARVDTICFDKTGTLTKGNMHVENIIKLKNFDEKIIKEINYHLDNKNPTMNALVEKYGKENKKKPSKIISFSSEKKWSLVSFENDKTYIIGAIENIIKQKDERIKKEIDKYINDYRILVIATTNELIKEDKLPKNIEPLGLILIDDEIRKETKAMIKYLEKNNINVKIISGDNPKTIKKIAQKLELPHINNYIDTTNMKEEELRKNVEKYTIFGRVTPQQKKIIIKSLQDNNHIVAMTGDGVNDVLALKQADCAIALPTGSEAAKNVSEFVLLNSNFNSIPKIIKEGRRIINNIERSSSLFITKTIYSLILLFLFLLVRKTYPFIPIQLTLTSVFTIGIPSLILALEPNDEITKGKFIINVISKSLPTALTIIFNIILVLALSNKLVLSKSDISTLGILLIAQAGFMHIYRISKPLNLIRTILLLSMIGSFLIAVFGFENIFSLSLINKKLTIIYAILAIISYFFLNIIIHITNKIIQKRGNKWHIK